MTDNTTANTGTEASAKKPRVVKHIDERIADLTKQIEEKQAALAELIARRDSEAAVNDIKEGDIISFNFGRKTEKTEPQVLSGKVLARGVNDKGVVQFNVLTGEGIDLRTLLIAATAVIVRPSDAE